MEAEAASRADIQGLSEVKKNPKMIYYFRNRVGSGRVESNFSFGFIGSVTTVRVKVFIPVGSGQTFRPRGVESKFLRHPDPIAGCPNKRKKKEECFPPKWSRT